MYSIQAKNSVKDFIQSTGIKLSKQEKDTYMCAFDSGSVSVKKMSDEDYILDISQNLSTEQLEYIICELEDTLQSKLKEDEENYKSHQKIVSESVNSQFSI